MGFLKGWEHWVPTTARFPHMAHIPAQLGPWVLGHGHVGVDLFQECPENFTTAIINIVDTLVY